MTHCLIVDDDAELRGLVADYLQRFGITSEQAADGASMRRALARRTQTIDVVRLEQIDVHDQPVRAFLDRTGLFAKVLRRSCKAPDVDSPTT